MPNRLGESLSPYLRQHAENPVDWFEFGDEALAAAAVRQIPILLSVGYASCHWCHVMAHESFEDPETAAVMNALFVNVKVDREERPDIDALYMGAVQALTGRGGWPMTVWLTPDGRPFFAGTYFPKTDRHGMPAFRRVMAAVAEAWAERREDVVDQADRLVSVIARTIPPSEGIPSPEAVLHAYGDLAQRFDRTHGGFGTAPKFPQAPNLELVLRVAVHHPDAAPEAKAMLDTTLRAMARGGIHDQLGGGFSRYSVDEEWRVPHFEKMLSDNAQLARLYLRGGQVLDSSSFLAVAESILEYLRSRLRSPDGGFFSGEDADSEGVEGRYYVFTFDEVSTALPPLDAAVVADAFGLTGEGANVLRLAADPAEIAVRRGVSLPEVEEALARGRRSLLELRSHRIPPAVDDKVVTAWNGLAIRAFSEAGAVLDRTDYLDEARAAARFVLGHHRRDDGRLLRSSSRGRATVPAFLDDYAALAVGLFTLYAATGEVEWFRTAKALTETIPTLFSDPDGSGFVATGADAEALVLRPQDQLDNPTPSGTSLAVEALTLLSAYTGDPEPRRRAEDALRANGLLVERQPAAVGYLTALLATLHAGTREVAIVGPSVVDLSRPVWEAFHPEIALAPSSDGGGADDVPLLVDRFSPGRTVAYVCSDLVCRQPTEDIEELRAMLAGPAERP